MLVFSGDKQLMTIDTIDTIAFFDVRTIVKLHPESSATLDVSWPPKGEA